MTQATATGIDRLEALSRRAFRSLRRRVIGHLLSAGRGAVVEGAGTGPILDREGAVEAVYTLQELELEPEHDASDRPGRRVGQCPRGAA